MEKYSNELYKGMEEYNEKTIKDGKVLELSKEYLELKKVIVKILLICLMKVARCLLLQDIERKCTEVVMTKP